MDMLTPSSTMYDEIILSPQRRSVDDSSPGRKRKTTPSPETVCPKKLLIISPSRSLQPQQVQIPLDPSNFGAGHLLGSNPTIESRRPHHLICTHGHPGPVSDRPSVSSQALPTQLSRHVILPFDLHQDSSQFHHKENYDLLFQIFPGVEIVEFDDYSLIFRFQELPPHPWPKTVAGVPCYLTADPNDRGPTVPFQHWSRSQIYLQDNIDLRDNHDAVCLIFDLVRDFFSVHRIAITEVQNWGSFIIIILESETEQNLDLVPRAVAKCPCFYLFESEMERPRELPAFRAKQVLPPFQVDDNKYEILRPGVMLSSGKLPDQDIELLSSSGILVKDFLGNEYMTVAAHAFPGTPSDGKVHHPRQSDTPVGEVIHELTHTDMGLVKLHHDVQFVNEVFENTVKSSAPVKFEGFVRAASNKIGEPFFMDNPFSGFTEGNKRAHAIMKVPADDPLEPKQIWLAAEWAYMGQGSSKDMPNGVYGSTIWNSDNRVTGFLRYAPQSGHFKDFCLHIAADPLIDRGYTIA